MSTDGGKNFDRVLAASTPNDGSEAVVLPDAPTTHARIKIEAVGNYFFDTNDAEFTVTAADTVAPNTTITSGPKQNSVVLSKTVHLGYHVDRGRIVIRLLGRRPGHAVRHCDGDLDGPEGRHPHLLGGGA